MNTIRDWFVSHDHREKTYWPSNVNLIFDNKTGILSTAPFVQPTFLDTVLHLFARPDKRALTDEPVTLKSTEAKLLDGLMHLTYMYNPECQLKYLEDDGRKIWIMRPSSCKALRQHISKINR